MRATPLLLVISRRSLVNRGGLTLSRVQEFNDERKAKDFLFNKKRKRGGTEHFYLLRGY